MVEGVSQKWELVLRSSASFRSGPRQHTVQIMELYHAPNQQTLRVGHQDTYT